MTFPFQLPDSFIADYTDKDSPFGYRDAAGNSLGELVYARTYSRRKDDGTKEKWYETCRRVTEFTFSVQKQHALENRLPWNGPKALASAKRFYDSLYFLRWTPPGRGLFSATEANLERRNSASLNNCTMVSTIEMSRHDPSKPFRYVMDMSMVGCGCGFDTRGSELGIRVNLPKDHATEAFVVPDTREGWVESVGLLINSYLTAGKEIPVFDYSAIRPAGASIKTFGGVASGSAPLEKLHEDLTRVFENRTGDTVDSRLITDIMNLIGVCVVSGNVRRSALIALGENTDEEFINLKNYEKYPERAAWGWMSNNSVFANVGDDLSGIVEGVLAKGEPGVAWLDMLRTRGRLADPPVDDSRIVGMNPCGEIGLESYELCNLSEVFLNNVSDKEEFLETLKSAYLYAKSVALLPSHWQETNAVMLRNRRIGLGLTGIANFVDNVGRPTLREWMDDGYAEVQRLDKTYSEWLCVRESIKTTTCKPSGSVSILGGASPGVHWQSGSTYFLRRVVFDKNDPMVIQFLKAGYPVIESAYTPETSVVVEFPIKSDAKRSEAEVPIFEKIDLAAQVQEHWADNSVSVTVSFDPETEADKIGTVLHMYEGRLKTVSFLPMGGVYEQMPYESITEDEYEERRVQILPVDMSPIYGMEAEESAGENYCSTASCEIKEFTAMAEDNSK